MVRQLSEVMHPALDALPEQMSALLQPAVG